MGGTVGVSIKRENGEVIKMARKTGSYSSLFTSKEFNSNELDLAVDNYIKIFFDMKKDYQNGKPYQYPMSGVYGYCNELAPVSYGLVVIDLKQKKIHSLQGYDNPGNFYPTEFSYYLKHDEKTNNDYDFLFRNNKLLVINDNKHMGTVHEVFGNDITLEKMKNIIKDAFSIKSTIINLFTSKKEKLNLDNIIFKPAILNEFESILYEESHEGIIQFAKNLIEDDFTFNNEEILQWIDFMNEYLEDIELEEDNDEWSDEEYDQKVEELAQDYRNQLQSILENKNTVKPNLK